MNDLTYYSAPRTEIVDMVPTTARQILEVGCGTGAFCRSLKQRGAVNFWGLELNEAAAAEAKKTVDHLIIGNIEHVWADLPDQAFDAIVFNDVLEHLIDPFSLLERLKAKLVPQGRIIASIPNVRYIRTLFDLVVGKDWRYVDLGILDRTHLRFFTKKSMQRLFTDAGFQVEAMNGINATQHWWVKAISALSFGFLEDTLYMQYVISAKAP